MDVSNIVRATVTVVPAVKPYLKGKALAFVWNIDPAFKTEEYFQSTVEHLIQQVYGGNMGGEFVDIMQSLITGQLTDAVNQAWSDDGNTDELPDYLNELLNQSISDNTDFDLIYGLYKDTVDARVDQSGTDDLMNRADMWAHQWDATYNSATLAINTNTGGKGQWVKGQTEKGCDTCARLDGIVAYFSEWDQLGVHPQGYPNDKLECEGGGPANNCDCEIQPTDQRRSPDALTTIMNIVER